MYCVQGPDAEQPGAAGQQGQEGEQQGGEQGPQEEEEARQGPIHQVEFI